MKHNGSLSWARMFMLATVGLGAACGSGSSGNNESDASIATSDSGGGSTCSTAGTSAPTPACGNPGIVGPVCGTPLPTPVIDLTGTWVMQMTGAQVVQASGFTQPFHIKSITTSLVQVTQAGSAVTFDGQYCNRVQQDDPKNPAQVLVLEAWRLTPTPFHRTGTFASDTTGNATLSMPSLVETYGARLTDPACDTLPLDRNDPRLFDDDNDGAVGISVGLKGLITGTMSAVQRQVTALTGYAVTAERIEGGMSYSSDQTVVASEPANIECLYRMSNSYTDPTECSSTFVMVKLPASVGPVDCAGVRANQATLGL